MNHTLARSKNPTREALSALGVHSAQQALAQAADCAPEDIHIEKDALGKPHGHANNRTFSVSISHAAPFVLAAASRKPEYIGVDIERIRVFPQHVAEAFLTAAEQAVISAAPAKEHDALCTTAWSLKEAALKALGVGLRQHPRTVDVSEVLAGKKTIYIDGVAGGGSARHWRVAKSHVAATVALPIPHAIL